MTPLNYPNDVRGVLSFDFDGTLHLPHADTPVEAIFFDTVESLRSEGWVWGINTGRSLMQMVEGINESQFPFLPDFVIAREREIFTPGKYGRWNPVEDWRKRCEKDHKVFFKKAKKFLSEVRDYVERETDASWVEQEGDPAGVIATSEEEMAQIVAFVEAHRADVPLLGYLRNTIYLRFSHIAYHKGSSLRELARRAGVTSDEVFGIGDGHNDLDKLHPDVCGMIACVGNSQHEVKQHVLHHGGYVAEAHGSLGSVEALDYFLRSQDC